MLTFLQFPKATSLLFFLLFFTVQTKAQTIDLDIDIEDAFLKEPVIGVDVAVYTTDSVLVTDTVHTFSFRDRFNRLQREVYELRLKPEKRDYLIHASRLGYTEVWKRISVTNPQAESIEVKLEMRKDMSVDLDEVVVKATRLKFYYKGDTLVYNADAFKLPDGSMLDALIRQLPGVTMTDNGVIYVNGRKVDELMLGSRSFFKGNGKVLQENLPYYTVKDIKVYDKQTDKSEALGYDVEERIYVMDVNLKKEFSIGYIANVETAVGTEDRWLGRGFLLGFTNRWRYSLMGNTNNVNENRHIGQEGYWTPALMPQSLVKTQSVATDLDYESKGRNVKNNFNADYTTTDTESEMRRWSEQFLEGINPTSQTENRTKSDNWKLKLKDEFKIKKPVYFEVKSFFDIGRRKGYGNTMFEQWDDRKTASMRTDMMSEGKNWRTQHELSCMFNVDREKKRNVSLGAVFMHNDDRSWLSKRYDTWQADNQESIIRHNANDMSNRFTAFLLSANYVGTGLLNGIDLIAGEQIQLTDTKLHDYLYHPDTLLLASQLDMLTAITDVSNSYDSHHRLFRNNVTVSLKKPASYKLNGISMFNINYDLWKLELELPVYHQSLDYKRGVIDTLVNESNVLFSPSFSFNKSNGKGKFRFNIKYKSDEVDLMNKIDFRDDSQPLIVKLGNPKLKGQSNTIVTTSYSNGSIMMQRNWNVGATFDYRHTDVAQSSTYNPETGVYTYKPVNVSGSYSATTSFGFSSSIDKKRHLTCGTNLSANYHHSVDYSMLAGETESHENKVNTISLRDGAYIQYNRNTLNIKLTGDINWRNSKGRMRDFKTLNVIDYKYGFTARYTIPVLKTTVAADATMYSRRGYGSSLNTDDFIFNAALSQSFLKGKLIARVDAFDILQQLSSVRYEVNAQGRIDTWYRCLPHYVMFHLAYHWNKNPKKH